MTTSLEDTSKPWAKIAEKWVTYFKPPSRPSKSEVAKYDQWLKKYAQPGERALVLGATPELLDILADNNIATDLIDINEEMAQAMIAITKKPDYPRNVMIGNWLDMPIQSDTYDLVLGDAVVPNVPYESRHAFMNEVRRILKPNAVFLNRAFCVPGLKKYKTIDEILKAFRDKPVDETTAIELVLEMQILTWDPSDHLGSMPKVREEVLKLRDENGFHREDTKENGLLEILWEYWVKDISDKVWVYDTRTHEEQEIYEPNFKITEVFEADDHPYGSITPLYLLDTKV